MLGFVNLQLNMIETLALVQPFFVVQNPCLPQQINELFGKCSLSMMFNLICNVLPYPATRRQAHRKCTVTFLPSEFCEANLVVYPR